MVSRFGYTRDDFLPLGFFSIYRAADCLDLILDTLNAYRNAPIVALDRGDLVNFGARPILALLESLSGLQKAFLMSLHDLP